MAKNKEKTEQSQSREEKDSAQKDPELKEAKKKLTAEERKAARAEQKARMKEIRDKRKELKKELRLTGVKNRADFESFARDLELTYPKGTFRGMAASTAATASRVGSIIGARFTVKSALVLLSALLAGTFMVAYISEEKGHFTINLTADMMREGFIISDTEDFEDPSTRLFADEVTNSNPTSVYEITRNIAEVDGSHNGPGYLAYTWYIKNGGQYVTDYGYTVNILSETMGTASAAWVMFFEDDKQIMYAQGIEQEDGSVKPENLWGYPQAPFYDSAYDPEYQYYSEEKEVDGQLETRWGITTTPFVDGETVLQGYVKDFEPGAVKKYTCVVWLEGDDPDCNNSILGGHVGFNIQYDRLGAEDTSYFKGLFRVEYKEYYQGNTSYEYEQEESQVIDAHQTEPETEEVTYYDVDVTTEAYHKETSAETTAANPETEASGESTAEAGENGE